LLLKGVKKVAAAAAEKEKTNVFLTASSSSSRAHLSSTHHPQFETGRDKFFLTHTKKKEIME
jgi:hypothetical protein